MRNKILYEFQGAETRLLLCRSLRTSLMEKKAAPVTEGKSPSHQAAAAAPGVDHQLAVFRWHLLPSQVVEAT